MLSKSPFEKAIFHRPNGRYADATGTFIEVQKHLLLSKDLFLHIKDPLHEISTGIQSVVAILEAYKWSLFDKYKEQNQVNES